MEIAKIEEIKNKNENKHCPIEEMLHQLGYNHQPKRYLFIPIKDKNGIPKDKFLEIVEGGTIHKQLLNGGTKLPVCWIVEE